MFSEKEKKRKKKQSFGTLISHKDLIFTFRIPSWPSVAKGCQYLK